MKKKALPKDRGAPRSQKGPRGFFPGRRETAIREKDKSLKGAVMGETHTPGQGRSQFPSLVPEHLLWALGHVDATEPRVTLTVCPSQRADLWTQRGRRGWDEWRE